MMSVRSRCASVKICASGGRWPVRVRTTRQGCCLPAGMSGPRNVRAGLSRRTVSAPTMMASHWARSFMASARAASPVIHWPSPAGRVMRPSRLMPALAMTQGRPVVMSLAKGAITSRHSLSRMPVVTAIPAAASNSRARPACRGFGSSAPHTTRATPAAMMASTQGGVRPCVEHGSSVTYSVPPPASAPRRASTSAWGPPAWRCQPLARSAPSFTSTAPTQGFGLVSPVPRRASSSASNIQCASPVIFRFP